jgi:hypothetical protein
MFFECNILFRFISINLLIKFMFFSSVNVFIWKLWLWFYSLVPTYSATFEEFLDNCSSHFESMFLLIDTVRMDELEANSLVLVHLTNLMLMEFWRHCLSHLQGLVLMKAPSRKNGGVCMRRSICNAREDGRCCNKT